MPPVVVVFFVPLQAFQHEGRAGHEQAVGAEDDEEHRHEKQQDRLERALDGQSDEISRAEGTQAEDQEEPLDPGLPLACVGSLQKLHRLHAPDADGVYKKREKIQGEKDYRGDQQGRRAEVVKARHDVPAKQPADEQRGQLVKQHPEAQPQQHGQQGSEQRFEEQHMDDMVLFHAQYVIEPVLAPAPLHQEAVDIQDQDKGQKADDDRAQSHEQGKVRSAQGLRQPLIHRQRQQNIETAEKPGLRQDAGEIQARVFLDVLGGNAGIESVLHPAHLPIPCEGPAPGRALPVRSIVRVSEIFLYSSSLDESPR